MPRHYNNQLVVGDLREKGLGLAQPFGARDLTA